MSTERGFHRHGSNSYVAEFAESEREVLLNLIEQLIELLSERVDHGHEDPLAALVGITSHDSPPEDEVLRRLLPSAYADEVDASEFRRYTESTLRGKKQAHAMSMRMYLKSADDGIVDLDQHIIEFCRFNDLFNIHFNMEVSRMSNNLNKILIQHFDIGFCVF
mgnify:CR=1 FL=1